MKKLNYLLSVLIIATFVMSFRTASKEKLNNSEQVKLELALSVNQSGWGSWKTTDCFRGLDFRVKRGNYNQYAKKYKWFVQFKNRYDEKIYFNFAMVEYRNRSIIKNSGDTKYRGNATANGGIKESYFLVDDDSSVYVYVNKVRLGEKDWGKDYYDCDK